MEVIIKFEEIKNIIDNNKYSNALEDCFLLLKKQGMNRDESKSYLRLLWEEIDIKKQNKLYSKSGVEFLFTQIKKEVSNKK